MNRPTHCVYCLLRVDAADNFLRCDDCNMNCHIGCLKRPGTPGDIVGDCFFTFRCSHCTDDGREDFNRQHLPWAMMVVMALHQLSVHSRGLSHHGYFHWRTHIACFIEKNWMYLMGSSSQKKKKKWIGTISGTLSHNTPVMFQSGFATFQEQGWWKLTHPTWSPKKYMEFYQTQRSEEMKAERLAAQAAAAAATAAAAAATAAAAAGGGPSSAAAAMATGTVPKLTAASHLAQQQQQQQLVTATESEVSIDEDVDIMQVPTAKRSRVAAVAATGASGIGEPVPPKKKKKYSCSRLIPYMDRVKYKKKLPEQNTIEADLAAFLSSNISAVDLHLNLDNITSGLANATDHPPSSPLAAAAVAGGSSHHAIPSTSAAAAAATAATSSGHVYAPPLMPSTSGGTRRPATTSENWPDQLLDLDFLKSVELMSQLESGETEPESAADASAVAAGVDPVPADADYGDYGDDNDDGDDDYVDDDQKPIMLLMPTELTPETMFQPRIVQVTDFQAGDHEYQEILNDPTIDLDNSFDEDSGETVVVAPNRVKEEQLTTDDEADGDATGQHCAGAARTGQRPAHFQTANATAEESVEYATRYPLLPSLFTRNPNWNSQPWLIDEPGDAAEAAEEAAAAAADDDAAAAAAPNAAADEARPADGGEQRVSLYAEAEMLRQLRFVMRESDAAELAAIPTWVRRTYRKLVVREWHRSIGETPFDLDEWFATRRRAAAESAGAARPGGARNGRAAAARPARRRAQWLDRYVEPSMCAEGQRRIGSAWRPDVSEGQARMAGAGAETEPFRSPQTGRMLIPLIFRLREVIPPWVRLMSEVQYVVNNEMPFRSSIDFYYVRPCHIAAVNALLRQTFWPGIDMSETLCYPDYSVVAMYKKLVVGCAFLVPDVGHNTAYISFMAVRPHWQKHGIATFMLYHLAQTSPLCDITLHVSVTNTAVMLYQKFGFKIEEFVRDFYEQYLPSDSTQNRTALFMRRKRDFVGE